MSEADTEVTSVSRLSEPEILDDLPTTINETTGTIVEADETYAPVPKPEQIKEEAMEEVKDEKTSEPEKVRFCHDFFLKSCWIFNLA